MIDLGLRRHFGVLSDDWNHNLLSIEKIDSLLDLSKSFFPTHNAIVIYGEQGKNEFLIGREVTGLDMDFVGHEEIQITDYQPITANEVVISTIADLDFTSWINRKYDEYDLTKFRLEIHNFESAVCSFF